VLVEGNVVRLESGEIVIAAGCAGISFFVTSIALAAVLGQLGKVTAKTQVVMILVAGLGAMVFNWLRIIALILIGIYSHMQSPLMADHGAFGWSLFAVWIFAFVLWSTNFGATRIEGPSVRHQFANPPLRPTLLPAAALMIVPLWVQIAPAFAVDREARAMDGSGPLLGVAWAPVFENADAVSLRAIPDGDARLWVFEASYTAQRQGKELFGPNNSILGDLALLESQRAANHSFEDLWARDGQGGYWQLRYAYLVGDAASADRWRTTLALVKRRFRGRSDARVIAIARACEEAGCDAHDKASIDVTWSKLSTAAKP
jgi:exosortase/archaeosortase family protein